MLVRVMVVFTILICAGSTENDNLMSSMFADITAGNVVKIDYIEIFMYQNLKVIFFIALKNNDLLVLKTNAVNFINIFYDNKS